MLLNRWHFTVLGALAVVMAVATEASAAPCAFESESAALSSLTVQPGGTSSPFHLNLDKLPLKAIPGIAGNSSIEVQAPLRFTGTQATNHLGAHVRKQLRLADGRILLARGLTPRFPRVESEDFEAFSEAGQIAVTLPLPGFSTLKPLPMPCTALSIADDAPDYEQPTLKLLTRGHRHVQSDEPLSLYEKPLLRDPLKIKFRGGLQVVAERPGWVKLRARWSDGSRLQGWVPSESVEIQVGIPDMMGAGGGGIGGLGMCGGGHRGPMARFRIHAHAPIHDGANGTVWAYAASTITVEAFPLTRSDGWVQISKVEGLPTGSCTRHSRIWVHVKHLLWNTRPLRP